MMKRLCATRILPCLLLALTIVAGCDSASVEQDAPPVIPSDAFSMQTDIFAGSASKSASGHFLAAALRVWPVSAVIGAHLLIPAALTSATLQAGDPRLENGAFVWASTTQAGQHDVSFSLSGDPTNSYIDWTMSVEWTNPETNELEEFTLFTARTDPNSKTGTWSLFYPIDGVDTNVLNAEYEITSDTVKTIEFSVPEGVDNAGASVSYSQDGDERAFEWFQADESQTHTISWNAQTKAGWIISTNYNGGAKACWDAQLQDTECAP